MNTRADLQEILRRKRNTSTLSDWIKPTTKRQILIEALTPGPGYSTIEGRWALAGCYGHQDIGNKGHDPMNHTGRFALK